MRIALFGGSFDPPHLAHQMACLYLLQAEEFDRVWMVPCFRHAFGKPLSSFEHRLKMCSLVARPFGGRVLVSEVERNLSGEGVNRTVDTLRYLKAHHPEDSFTLVIGSDILSETQAWKGFEGLKKESNLLVLRRGGFPDAESGWNFSRVALPAVSSTEIRNHLSKGIPIDGLVPSSVKEYISQHSLYRP